MVIKESAGCGARGATVARLTPDQKVACSNHVGLSCIAHFTSPSQLPHLHTLNNQPNTPNQYSKHIITNTIQLLSHQLHPFTSPTLITLLSYFNQSVNPLIPPSPNSSDPSEHSLNHSLARLIHTSTNPHISHHIITILIPDPDTAISRFTIPHSIHSSTTDH